MITLCIRNLLDYLNEDDFGDNIFVRNKIIN